MLSENLDDKIKEMLVQQKHDFDESSWSKMKALLDKHLPEKKKDRRLLFFILFFILILGGGLTVFFTGNFNKPKPSLVLAKPEPVNNIEQGDNLKTTEAATQKENTVPQTAEEKSTASEEVLNSTTPVPAPSSATGKNLTQVVSSAINPVNRKTVSKKNITNPINNKNIINKTYANGEKDIVSSGNSIDTKNTIENTAAQEKVILVTGNEVKSEQDINKETIPDIKATEQEKIVSEEKVSPEKTIPASKNSITNKKTGGLKNLFFTLSAGPDISAVGLDKTGKLRPSFGAGLGYKISNRFSVRTGIYSGRKVYTAGPEDYNPPKNFWAYYPNLKTIDADCKVLEIPLVFDYSFGYSKNKNWFVSTGLSSYFMKKEVYEYYFKPNNSTQYIYYTRSYNNVNKHYFAVLNLSGGYKKQINPHLSLQAEPYMKIAMAGVGYGKVKLNSGGVLLSAIIQPFKSAQKKLYKK